MIADKSYWTFLIGYPVIVMGWYFAFVSLGLTSWSWKKHKKEMLWYFSANFVFFMINNVIVYYCTDTFNRI